jgi:hypothetical protein
VTEHVDRLDGPFSSAGSMVVELLRRPEIAGQWSASSALAKMSVGALACHLGRQVVRAAELLSLVTDVPALESADAHYRRATWVTASSPDEPANDRSLDDAEATLGHTALQQRVVEALGKARDQLTAGTARDVVLIPWQGWSLRRDDFLLTRLLEIVVHADDLALSVSVATPSFPDEVFDPVSELLVRLAVRRHGQSAVISTLTRRERSREIAAF